MTHDQEKQLRLDIYGLDDAALNVAVAIEVFEFPVRPWFKARCQNCGHVASSEHFKESKPPYGDPEIFCPVCGSDAIASVPKSNYIVEPLVVFEWMNQNVERFTITANKPSQILKPLYEIRMYFIEPARRVDIDGHYFGVAMCRAALYYKRVTQ